MNSSQQRIWIVLSFICFQCAGLSAQNNQRFELGAGITSFIYQGDLAPSRIGSLKTPRLGINLFRTKLLSPSFSLRTNLAIGGLRGDDAKYDNPEYRRHRNFNFRTPVVELSQLAIWNPLKTNYEDKGFYPYLFGGVGISFLNIKRDWSNFEPEYFAAMQEDVSSRLGVDTAHSLPRVIPVVPFGLGLRYNLSSRWAINAEGTYRLVFTDYLDGFSHAANPELNDRYHSITIGAIYRIGKKNTLDCPVVRY